MIVKRDISSWGGVRRLNMFGNRMLVRIFGPNREAGENLVTLRRISWDQIKADDIDWMRIPNGDEQLIQNFSRSDWRKRTFLKPGHWYVNNIKMDHNWDVKVCTGFVWLRIGSRGGLLWTRHTPSGSIKYQRKYHQIYKDTAPGISVVTSTEVLFVYVLVYAFLDDQTGFMDCGHL